MKLSDCVQAAYCELQRLRSLLPPPLVRSPVRVFINVPAGARVDTLEACPLPRRRK